MPNTQKGLLNVQNVRWMMQNFWTQFYTHNMRKLASHTHYYSKYIIKRVMDELCLLDLFLAARHACTHPENCDLPVVTIMIMVSGYMNNARVQQGWRRHLSEIGTKIVDVVTFCVSVCVCVGCADSSVAWNLSFNWLGGTFESLMYTYTFNEACSVLLLEALRVLTAVKLKVYQVLVSTSMPILINFVPFE